jgi:hypothetical protein
MMHAMKDVQAAGAGLQRRAPAATSVQQHRGAVATAQPTLGLYGCVKSLSSLRCHLYIAYYVLLHTTNNKQTCR